MNQQTLTNPQTLIGLALIVVVVVAITAIIAALIRKHRSEHLKRQFGAEYDRAVVQRGDTDKAELELIKREKRVQSFSIKALSPAERDRFREEWNVIQNRFVDDPAIAVSEADSLVSRVMEARGYPMADFEQRAADVSVSYPGVVQNYRAARVIIVRHGRGEAGTEDLRQAMVHYRSLFDELLGEPSSSATKRNTPYERAS